MKIQLRELWPNEASDFTPWLKENHLIEDIIHSIHLYQNPIKFWKAEVPCGDYRMDMIYKEVEGCGRIIVENQYARSDSKHLGQILVYSQLSRIKDILWISESVGMEHRGISKVLKGIHVIPVSIQIDSYKDGYSLNVYVYDRYNLVLSYVLDRNKNILYKK